MGGINAVWCSSNKTAYSAIRRRLCHVVGEAVRFVIRSAASCKIVPPLKGLVAQQFGGRRGSLGKDSAFTLRASRLK